MCMKHCLILTMPGQCANSCIPPNFSGDHNDHPGGYIFSHLNFSWKLEVSTCRSRHVPLRRPLQSHSIERDAFFGWPEYHLIWPLGFARQVLLLYCTMTRRSMRVVGRVINGASVSFHRHARHRRISLSASLPLDQHCTVSHMEV